MTGGTKTITLPSLHKHQRGIDSDPARFKVVVCGRRFGKTTYGVRKCIKGALETGLIFWWVGPNYKQADIGWKLLKFLAWQISQVSQVEVREADKEVIFENGGRICIRSAVDPDSLRGEKLGGVVLDEFAQIKEETWTDVLRPALADHKGWALFIGTPMGKNWAYKLFMRAKNFANWAAFQIPTGVTEDGTAHSKVIASNNPYIDLEEIEAARQDMSPESFAQEWLADFGASQYLVYPTFNPDFHEWRGPVPEFVSYHGGMDFGGDTIGAHESCTVLAGRTAKDELIVIAAFQQSGPNIAERQYNWAWEQELSLADIHRQLRRPWYGVRYRADKSQMTAIQFMRQSGLNVWKTKGGPDSVMNGIELVQRRIKLRPEGDNPNILRSRFFVLKGVPYVMDAMMSYRYPEPHNDGRVEAKNPLKVKDDMVDAVRYMVEDVDNTVVGDPQELYSALVPRLA